MVHGGHRVASGDGAAIAAFVLPFMEFGLVRLFLVVARLRRSSEAKAAPPQAANNLAQRMSIFMTTSIQCISAR